MKTLAEFLAEFLTNVFKESEVFDNLLEDAIQQVIVDGLDAYKDHLQNDSPKTVQWAMVESQLILALEKMQSHNHLNSKDCDHEWVNRNDGYEETCGPAICIRCGLYGCWCTAKWSEMSDEEKKAFEENGINGNNHEIEKRLKAVKIKTENNQLPSPLINKICTYPDHRKDMGCKNCPCEQTCEVKEIKHKPGCASYNNPPRGFASSVSDCDCKDYKDEYESDIGKVEYPCLQPSNFSKPLGCVNCESLLACTNNKNRHCKECILFDLKAKGNCREPGYGTLANNNACDRFKLKVLRDIKCPICPLNLYFEGDEDKIDSSKCDFENRRCTNACNPNSTRKL